MSSVEQVQQEGNSTGRGLPDYLEQGASPRTWLGFPGTLGAPSGPATIKTLHITIPAFETEPHRDKNSPDINTTSQCHVCVLVRFSNILHPMVAFLYKCLRPSLVAPAWSFEGAYIPVPPREHKCRLYRKQLQVRTICFPSMSRSLAVVPTVAMSPPRPSSSCGHHTRDCSCIKQSTHACKLQNQT